MTTFAFKLQLPMHLSFMIQSLIDQFFCLTHHAQLIMPNYVTLNEFWLILFAKVKLVDY